MALPLRAAGGLRLALSLATALLLPARVAPWNQWGDGSANAPSPRAEHSMTFFNDSIFVFGGRGNNVSGARPAHL